MPIPTPNTGETSEDFLQRCMGDSKMNEEYPDTSQRYAVCIAQTKKEETKNILIAISEFIKSLKNGK